LVQLGRSTLHGGLVLAVAIVLATGLPTRSNAAEPRIVMPRPFYVAIDDMGWNEGSSLAGVDGPWRLGVRRTFDLNDYKAVVELGRAVGVRLQGTFILGEMDQAGAVASVPSAVAPGAAKRRFDPERQREIMQYIQDNAAHLEFGLHGVGHEHWEDGVRHRAEWYDLKRDKPWPEHDGRDHLALFARIMAQYGWTAENGQSFPESFVPCANGLHWNPEGDSSTGKIMAEAGVKYANTDFSYVAESQPPIRFGGGFDHGLLVIHRKNYGNPWFALGALPTAPIRRFETDIIEAHWTNLLAQDYWLQPQVQRRWVALYTDVRSRPNWYAAKNTEQFSSQWLYRKYAKLRETSPGHVRIDNTRMPAEAAERDLLGSLVLSVPLAEGTHVEHASLDGDPIPAILERDGFGYLYLPPLASRPYELEYTVGTGRLEPVVHLSGTYNVYSLRSDGNTLRLDLEMYGTQVVELASDTPATAVRSLSGPLRVLDHHYDPKERRIRIRLHGRDMQGERGVIEIER
jgi:hypothetical protein